MQVILVGLKANTTNVCKNIYQKSVQQPCHWNTTVKNLRTCINFVINYILTIDFNYYRLLQTNSKIKRSQNNNLFPSSFKILII